MAKKVSEEDRVVLRFSERGELRQWLRDNGRSAKECWVVCARTSEVPDGVIAYLDVVEEALCFGWIDSTCKRCGEVLLQRLSPRRDKSKWTELNKERCRRLERLGFMTDAGRKVYPSNMDVELFRIDDEILAALQADEVVWRNFRSFPPLYQRVKIGNIQIKKGTELFRKRLERLVDYTRRNKMFGEWNDKGRLLEE